MAASFFFYDLETSGINVREARIMQFAGQRTDLDLNPIGEPVNELIKLSADVVPEPDAIMITGITPQASIADGLTEVEFLKRFYEEVVTPGTIFMGFNSIRFDDEFMRFLHYRNFYDAYEWQWCDDCSRWDLLDVVRMTRALRPEGIEWPFAPDGKPTNRLEFLTKVNGLDHEHAHDALNDVMATIAVAKLINTKQKDLFAYLLSMRDKKKVAELVLGGKPFAYTCGQYPSVNMHTSAAILLAKHPEQQCAYVYDLRHDPTEFMAMTIEELVAAARYSRDPEHKKLPVKLLKYNRCPAVAPLGVIHTPAVEERIHLTVETVARHQRLLQGNTEFAEKVVEAFKRLDAERPTQPEMFGSVKAVDGQLYDGFFPKSDTDVMRRIRTAPPTDVSVIASDLHDERLKALVPLFKARNYPQALTDDERQAWDNFCRQRLIGGGQSSKLATYFKRLETLAATDHLTQNQRYLLEELRLYGESIMPISEEGMDDN